MHSTCLRASPSLKCFQYSYIVGSLRLLLDYKIINLSNFHGYYGTGVVSVSNLIGNDISNGLVNYYYYG